MAKQVVVQKARANTKNLNLNMDLTGDTITSEIRERPEQTSTLIATWTVTVVDASLGKYTLFLSESDSDVTQKEGFMDVLRMTGGRPVSVFDEPLSVEFRGTVTAP